jgi:hypothetical protein
MKNAVLMTAFLLVFLQEVCGQQWEKLGNGISVTFGAPKDLFGDSASGKLYAVGVFPVPNFFTQKVLSWNGSEWDSVGTIDSTLVGIPQAIARYDNNLYLTGAFPSVGNVPANNIAYWDGANWNSIAEEPNGGGLTLAAIYNELYVGGVFDSIGTIRSPSIAKWDGTQWHALGYGIVTSSGNPAYIHTIAEYHGNIYVGGTFTDSATGAPLNLLRFNGTNWEHVPGWTNGTNSFIQALAVYHDELYVGGQFFKSEGSLGDHIVKWNDTTWSEIGGAGFTIRKLLVYHDELYACGDFSTIGGIPASHIAKWNGSKWCNLGNDYFDNGITEMTIWNDTLYIGGGFQTIEGDTFHHVAKWIGGDYTDSCGAPVSVSEIHQDNFFFSVFPNPSNDEFTLATFQNGQLTITNELGQAIQSFTIHERQIKILSTKFPSGNYFLTFQTSKNIQTKKLLIQH